MKFRAQVVLLFLIHLELVPNDLVLWKTAQGLSRGAQALAYMDLLRRDCMDDREVWRVIMSRGDSISLMNQCLETLVWKFDWQAESLSLNLQLTIIARKL